MSSHFLSNLIRKRLFDFTLLSILIFLVFGNWFTPGVIQFGDWNYFFNDPILDFFSGPILWNRWGLSYSMTVISSFDLAIYPIWFAQSVIVKLLGVNFATTERIFFFCVFPFVSAFSMYYLSYVMFKKRLACLFSSILYTFNHYILYWTEGGGINIAMATALAPAVLAFFIKGLKSFDLKSYVLSGLLFAISICYDLRVTYITFAVILSYLVFNYFHKVASYLRTPQRSFLLRETSNSLVGFAIFLIVPVMLHAFWIIPASMFGIQFPQGNSQPFWVPMISVSKLSDTLCLFHQWSLFIKPDTIFTWIFYLVPITAFSSILLRPRNRKIAYLSFLAVICIFFAKGSNEPFGDLFMWMFVHFPGFSAFREPSKFLSGASLAYALLFGVFAQEMLDKIGHSVKLQNLSIKKRYSRAHMKKVAYAFVFLLLILISLSGSQYVILGNRVGTLIPHSIPEEYVTTSSWLESQPDYFRTLWFPYHPDYIINNNEHPGISPYLGFPPFGYYFLFEAFNQNLTRYLGKIYGLASVKYIIISPNNTCEAHFLSPDPYIRMLDYQIGLERFSLANSVTIYENRFFIPRFYATSRSILLVGGKSALLELSPYLDFSEWVVFYVDQLKRESLAIWDKIDVVVFDQGKDIDDLTLALVDDRYRIHLSDHAKLFGYEDEGLWLKSFPGFDGYNPQYDGRGSFFEDKIGEIRESFQMVRAPVVGLDHSSPHAKMEIPIKVEESGPYDVWLRMGVGPDYGKLTLLVDNTPLQVFFSPQKYIGLKWVKLYTIYLEQGDHTLSLINHEGKNSLDDLVIIPQDVFLSQKAVIEDKLLEKEVVILNSSQNADYLNTIFSRAKANNKNIRVEWTRINPYKYQLYSNSSIPFFIVFSEVYDPHWVLASSNGEKAKSIVAWGGLNAFLANNGTSLTLYFPPQQYVETGIYVSISSMVLIGLYLFIPKKNTKQIMQKLLLIHRQKSSKTRSKSGKK